MTLKSYKLRGGWEKTDHDFIEYEQNELRPKVNTIGNLNKTLSEELVTTTNEKFGTSFENKEKELSRLDDLVAFIRGKSNENPELFQDDFNYNHIKFTVIPRGTMFYRRQTIPTFNNSHTAVWLDYSGTMANTPFSFLKDTNDVYTQEYLDKVKTYFGDYLLQLRTKKDLLIVNFPYYVTSYIECFIRRICVDMDIETCVDGYTMDLLQFNPNKIFKSLPSLSGFRELCLLDAVNLEFVKLVTPPRVIMSRQSSHLLSIKPAISSKKSKGSSTRSSRSSSKKSKGSSTRSSRLSSKKSKDSSTRSSRSSSKKSKDSSTRSSRSFSKKSKDSSTRSSRSFSKKSKDSSTRSSRSFSKKSKGKGKGKGKGSSTRSSRSSRSSSKKSRDDSYKEYSKQQRAYRYRSPSPHKSPKLSTGKTIDRDKFGIKRLQDEL